MMLKGGVHHLELIWLMHKQCALTGQRQNFQSERCPWTDYRLAVGVARIGAFALLCIRGFPSIHVDMQVSHVMVSGGWGRTEQVSHVTVSGGWRAKVKVSHVTVSGGWREQRKRCHM